jgi:hypothetical protein
VEKPAVAFDFAAAVAFDFAVAVAFDFAVAVAFDFAVAVAFDSELGPGFRGCWKRGLSEVGVAAATFNRAINAAISTRL